jgi:iron complex outermembrane receptor protein
MYGYEPIIVGGEEINSTDLVQRKWLDNDFYGTTFSVLKSFDKVNVIVGGAFNQYDGDHFGEVKWAKYGSETVDDRFYDNTGKKTDFNLYAKADYSLNERWSLFADMQYRYVNYEVEGIDEGPVNIELKDKNNFFNPKLGLTYFLDKSSFYLSYAKGHKEPKRADYLANNKVKPESLDDFELGWNYNTGNFRLKTNLYYMNYVDQLVLTGNIDNVGNPIADNIGKSYRLGLEIDAAVRFSEKFSWQPNLAFSTNKNIDKYYEFDGELTNFGNTDLSFSPGFIAGSNFIFEPLANMKISLLSKYVGVQYMSNIELEASKLEAYFVNDLHLSYEITTNKLLKSITFSGLINNFLNVKYVSNGYFYTYDDTWSDPDQITTITGAGYYPQAELNFLLGVNLKF